MADDAKPLWGARFRGDLQVMKALGANHVRLYGNNPSNSHANFLNEAAATGLKVIIGMSDYPYTQAADNCLFTTGFDCYSQVKAQYLENLKKGLLVDGRYNPALAEVIVINEPDLKLPGIDKPKGWTKGIISAIDGMLDAEKEMGVTGPLVNFTATFSFGVCGLCEAIKDQLGLSAGEAPPPGIGQMVELRAAMLDPQKMVGYTPKNNMAKFYKERFSNSFNTANPAKDIATMFMPDYITLFPSVPVSIQEYHKPDLAMSQEADLKEIVKLAEDTDLLRGISFFEFQVRYDKGGSEAEFGMFGLSDNFTFATWTYFGDEVHAFCLTPVYDQAGMPLSSAVAAAFGGPGVDYDTLCIPDPAKVNLDQVGMVQISAQGSDSRMAVFVGRVVKHMGGMTQDQSGLLATAQPFVGSVGNGTARSFQELVDEIGKYPSWASWDSEATCSADRNALAGQVAIEFGWVCGHFAGLNCSDIPAQCMGDIWTQADYMFSMYYNELGGDPFKNCFFGGTAIFENSMTYGAISSPCLVSKNPLFSALTNDGYQLVLSNKDPGQTALYMRRVAIELGGRVTDEAAVEALAAAPPATLMLLEAALKESAWVCGLGGGLACPTTVTTTSLPPRTVTTTSLPPTTLAPTGAGAVLAPTPAPWKAPPSGTEGGDSGTPLEMYVGIGAVFFVAIAVLSTLVASVLNARAKRQKRDRLRSRSSYDGGGSKRSDSTSAVESGSDSDDRECLVKRGGGVAEREGMSTSLYPAAPVSEVTSAPYLGLAVTISTSAPLDFSASPQTPLISPASSAASLGLGGGNVATFAGGRHLAVPGASPAAGGQPGLRRGRPQTPQNRPPGARRASRGSRGGPSSGGGHGGGGGGIGGLLGVAAMPLSPQSLRVAAQPVVGFSQTPTGGLPAQTFGGGPAPFGGGPAPKAPMFGAGRAP